MISNLDRCSRFMVLILAFGLCTFSVTRLNAQGATSTVLGTVADMSGASIPEAMVQAKNIGTGVSQSVAADSQGRFRIPDLAVGDYEIQATKTGFSTVVHKGVTLTVGSQTVIDFALPVGQQQQTVTVDAEVSQVETTNAAIGTFTSQQQMAELPLNGRNFEQLIQLAPGVATVNFSTNAMQGRAAQYSVAGGRPEGQAILLDDENLQSFWNNGMGSITGSSLGVEAIGEFQTLTNSYGAQFGGNGAVINAVSKSGTNSFHGSGFDFIRNSALDARDFFSTRSSPPAFRRNQYGGSVGGPVKKDKAFFFTDYEGIRQLFEENKVAIVPNCPAACTITATDPNSNRAIANTLALFPKPTTLLAPPQGQTISLQGLASTYGNQIVHEDYVLGRFDYMFSAKDSVFVRYFSDKASQVEPFGGSAPSVGGGPIPTWNEADASHGQYSTLEERHIISPTLVNVARISFSRPTKNAHETSIATAPDGSHPLQFFNAAGLQDGFVNLTATGISSLGGASALHFLFNQNRYTAADDVLWTHGSHSIRFGAYVARLQTNSWNQIAENATFTFTSFANFLAGKALNVTGVIPNPNNSAYRNYRETDFNPYIQDDWKLSSKLTVNLGLRWEFMTNPTENHNRLYQITNFYTDTAMSNVSNVFQSNPSWKNFDPRVGVAYDPFADHKTAIRAGFGIFHDPITVQAYQTGYGTAIPWATSLQNNPIYPFAFSAISPILPSQGTGWDHSNHVTPYMIQYNFNIQRELPGGTILTLGYVGSHGVHLVTQIEANPPVPIIDANGYHFATVSGTGALVTNKRQNPNLGGFPDLRPITSSSYNSLQVILNKRFSRNMQVQAAYTHSKCLDYGAFGVGSFNGLAQTPSSVENPFDQHNDRGPCSYDIPNVLRVNGQYLLPFKSNRLVSGWRISGIVSSYSGVPFNVNSGFDRAGFQLGNTPRPNYVAGCDPMAGFGTINQWFNPGCYRLQDAGTFGNSGRNTLRGPGFFNADVSLSKDTKLTERLGLQFRAEFFNALNHENFALPVNNVFSASTQVNSTVGRITSSNSGATPRQIQFGLKLTF